MNDDGVTVSCLGTPLFEAKWSELKYVGRFKHKRALGDVHQEWMYFSTIPVTVGGNIRRWAPNNADFPGNGFFMELYKKRKVLAEVHKHIPRESVVLEGRFIGGEKVKR